MATSVTVFSLVLVLLCVLNGVAESKLLSKDPPQEDKIENGNSPLEQKVDALTQVVENLLVESKAKDLKILNLEKRVSELEKRPAKKSIQIANPNDIQGTRKKLQQTVELFGNNKDNTSSNLIEHQTAQKYSESPYPATENKRAIQNILGTSVREPLSDSMIAFHAESNALQDCAVGTIVLFKKESLDTTNFFNTGDGIFVVPESGHYVFTWTITTDFNSFATTLFIVNDIVVGKTFADAGEVHDMHTSTGIIITSVSQGDNVFIRFGSNSHGNINNSYGQNTFSGWKLF